METTAQAIAQTWPVWSPQAAHQAVMAAGVARLYSQPVALPSGQIRTYKKEV